MGITSLQAGPPHLQQPTASRLQKIHQQARTVLIEASRQQQRVPARRLAGFTGLRQPVRLAVPLTRLHLRERCAWSSAARSGRGCKATITRQAWSDVEWWLCLRAQSRWNGRKIWTVEEPHEVAQAHRAPLRVRALHPAVSSVQWYDPGCMGADALAYSWLGGANWVQPPWSLLDKVAHKLWKQWCAATAVAPYWPGQMWLQQREALSKEITILPHRRDLFTPSRLGGSELLGPSSRDSVVLHISSSRSEAVLLRAYTYVVFALTLSRLGVRTRGSLDAPEPHQRVRRCDLDGSSQGEGKPCTSASRGGSPFLRAAAAAVAGPVQVLQHWQQARDDMRQQAPSTVDDESRSSYRKLP
eukprot:gene9374-biopygen9564